MPRTRMVRSGTAAARVAYSRLAGFLESELLPVAPAADAVGRERYALASRSFLGATVDLEARQREARVLLHRLEDVAGLICHRLDGGASGGGCTSVAGGSVLAQAPAFIGT